MVPALALSNVTLFPNVGRDHEALVRADRKGLAAGWVRCVVERAFLICMGRRRAGPQDSSRRR